MKCLGTLARNALQNELELMHCDVLAIAGPNRARTIILSGTKLSHASHERVFCPDSQSFNRDPGFQTRTMSKPGGNNSRLSQSALSGRCCLKNSINVHLTLLKSH